MYHADPSTSHYDILTPVAQEGAVIARGFRLQATLRENVAELMRVLGTVENPLSLRGLARQIDQRHPEKTIDYKMVERWVREDDPIEPDMISIAIMAGLAGVRFEFFALGRRHLVTDLATGETRIEEVDQPEPLIDPKRDRKLTAQEEQRALRAAEGRSSASAKKSRAKAKKRGAGGR